MAKLSWGAGPTQYFFELTPDKVMSAIEAHPLLGQKRMCTGYCQPLASFENRVYEVEFEEPLEVKGFAVTGARADRAVVKFYRPGRWTRDQILEEHQFMFDLLEEEIPVVVPYWFAQPGETLAQTEKNGEGQDGLFFCIYPKVGGRQPEDLPKERLQQLGRLIARMHGVGSAREAIHRVKLNPEVYGQASLDFLLQERFVVAPVELRIKMRFQQVVEQLIQRAKTAFKGQPLQRLHGDCHSGNILWNEKTGPFFIDFDDMVVGPPIQDLWLLAPDPENLKDILDGYHQWGDLPFGSTQLVEPLRGLRMLHYATWIAKRYDDPAFKKAFPHFESPRYWEELTQDLERQLERIP